jgi:hypothetical protein
MIEFNYFRSGRAPFTNFVGHQVSKVYSLCCAILETARHSEKNWKNEYNIILTNEQKYDFFRGNAITALGLMVLSLIRNSLK